MSDATATEILARVNARHGTELELVSKFAGGRQEGAWLARSAVSGDVVLKWTTHAGLARRRLEAAEAVARLRACGYPTPAWLASGVLDNGVAYSVQEHAEGEPGVWSTVPLGSVLAIVELQAGLGHPSSESWSTYVEWAARDGSGPRHLLWASAAGRGLVEHFDEVLVEHGPCDIPSDDLVHGDLNTSNVLVASRRVTAIIDIDAIAPGTRAVDYAWLLREAFTVNAPRADKDRIRAAGVRVAGSAVFATCVTATAFDIAVFEGWVDVNRGPSRELTALHALADFVRPSPGK